MTDMPKRFYVFTGSIRAAQAALRIDYQIDPRLPQIIITTQPNYLKGLRGIAIKVIDPDNEIREPEREEFARIYTYNRFRDWTGAEIQHLQAIS